MIEGEDSFITMKHLYGARHPDKTLDERAYRKLRHNSRQLIRPHFPHRMCVQMLLKPLGLGPRARRFAIPASETLARWMVP